MTYIRDMVDKTGKFKASAFQKASSGFTLLEVLVVVAIIGILGAIGVSSMRSKVAVEAVKGEVMTIRNHIDMVSAKARAQDTSYSLKVVTDSLFLYKGATCTGPVLDIYGLGDRVRIRSAATTNLPSPLSGFTTNWAATSTNCLQFTPRQRIGLHALATNGYLSIESRQMSSIWGMVGKNATMNKPLQFFSLDNGLSWSSI